MQGVSTVNAQSNGLEPAAKKDELQLKTLNQVKQTQRDNCSFLFFEIDEGS